jgi:transcriptional regulator with XRE-family HTH domain
MNIGKRIKEERQKRKWTQEQLGEKLNVSRSAVSSWEVGRNYPDLEAIILISDLLEISLDELLREDEEIVKDVTKKLKMNKTYKVLL